MQHIGSIPTNIITGFLGVGKTTAILQLLKMKPQTERWAVLVNEFGEIGIDGDLLSGSKLSKDHVFIREVPGGCMCCASGLPMQVALNMLLTKAKPHRLLIEPTGLGHPKEVLNTLTMPHYKDILDINKTITLVDARKLRDPRYTENDIFNQQIDIADVVLGNKQDLYQDNEADDLTRWLAKRQYKDKTILLTEQGRLDASVLTGPSHYAAEHGKDSHQAHHHVDQDSRPANRAIPDCGYLRVDHQGKEFCSVGWRFSSNTIFCRQALVSCLSGVRAERMKAVFITSEGLFGYNLTEDSLVEYELDECVESRIEIIAQDIDDNWESMIVNCRHEFKDDGNIDD